MRPPKLLLNNNFSGKPEDIYLFLGRHPKAAFGNSTGDQQMLEYTQAGVVLLSRCRYCTTTAIVSTPTDQPMDCRHQGRDSSRKAYTTKLNPRTGQSISMNNDWKRIFSLEK